ncbi:conserved phage C-terminal domain-containing protein [Sporosarcina pasteurii]|uniref:Conserved phage C-terminus (Phg_2220_C) n=1 Tax=Sporosarcina pasteurii TaxID=1474 RepID=A0A380CFM8_SPOPA|nr:conserved phage C-terminal domain-containing protein [Sporosarcina pasteurii]MDS9473204.1 conserved phage C-terminal domain-containing protein [Sporosarcina pasteurii]QBQ06937.1 replication protein [Sporosarcina pasteurii]SUJ18481.1 Conserved phage C-terminus (Phg_2220_C) [Sporosarcina pasteurii]
MNLLINESPLIVLPSLVKEVGLNEAILLQQLHYKSLISKNIRDGYKWVYRTYEEWKNEEFFFWSERTIQRVIHRLEEKGFIVSTDAYNRMKMDKTKWYRINYSMLQHQTGQNDLSNVTKSPEGEAQSVMSSDDKMSLAITKEVKSIKKHTVGQHPDAVAVINYLNEKAGKQYKASSKATERLVNARFREGYELADFKNIIDTKVNMWLNNTHWNKYLRPSTLFNATNFENYLEEFRSANGTRSATNNGLPILPELDFSKGEE